MELTTGKKTGTTQASPIKFPLYLMKGEVIEIEGKYYTIPEPFACNSTKDLCIFLYEKRVEPR